jgi:catechol 2,3-dioxygenase-like lactoylglutathione lyase family enzyme
MTQPVTLGFCIRYVPDVEKTIAFYERAFGMERKMIVEGGGYGELKGPPPLGFASEAQAESLVGAFAPARPGAKPQAGELGFVVDDVAAAFDRAIAAGAVAVAKPAKKPWGQIVAYVRDCDGALVEICTSWE